MPAPVFEMAIDGFRDGLWDLGFIEGKNLELVLQHANGDMSFLPQATANLVRRNPDILVAMSTSCLSSAIAHSEGINISPLVSYRHPSKPEQERVSMSTCPMSPESSS